ncbi:TPA: peptidoglycan DD-metalloendopeptidase family protein [Stenotrophomonas maltophilia]|nr:peptidoglycan DD-metalloendopeptidase family protein [Stenotrophomonas maltophilia]
MPTYNPGPPFRVSSDWSKARKHPTQGTVKRHEGQDWAAPAGTPIPAAADGHVIYTGWMNGYGNTIAVEHMIRGQVVHTMYAHMSAASPLKVKDKVKKGDPLGPVGMTGGVSSGNHLHFEVHPFAESGKLVLHKTVDPATFDFPDGEAVSGAFGYPFLLKDGEPARSLAAYMHAMRGAEDGFYPVGGNSLWHGGIHFGDGTANALAQGPTQLGEKSGVRCIADGEVVAYKLDSTYPAVQFRENQLKALYSTGFTLVRHTLVLPESTQLKACQPEDETADLEEQTRAAQMRSAIAVKMQAEDRKAAADAKEAQKAAAAEAAKDAKKGKKTEVPKAEATPERTESKPETLVLFSLYIHLMDWRGYRQDEKIPRAKYWKGDSTYRVTASAAEDTQKVPPPPPPPPQEESTADPFALPRSPFSSDRGFGLGESPLGGGWGQGQAGGQASVEQRGFGLEAAAEQATPQRVPYGSLPTPGASMPSSASATDAARATAASAPAAPAIKGRKGLNIRSEPNGKLLGMLGQGARVRFTETKAVGKGVWGHIGELLEGEIIAAEAVDGQVKPGAENGWVYLSRMEAVFDKPDPVDQVVVLDKPFPVKAGDIIGQIGEYQTFGVARASPSPGMRSMLHLEMFSGGDVPGFIGRSRAYAATRPENERNMLVLDVGVKLVTPIASDTALAAGSIVAIAADSPKGAWVKLHKSVAEQVPRKALGKYNEKTKRYADGRMFTGWYVSSTGERTQSEKVGGKWPDREVLTELDDVFWAEAARVPAAAAGKPLDADLPAWTRYPLQLSNQTTPAGKLPRVIARVELDTLGKEFIAIDDKGNRWWWVATDQAPGWVCQKDHPLTRWESPWAWPCFEYVEEGQLTPLDLMAWKVFQMAKSRPEEKAEHKMRADRVRGSSLHRKIYQLIDVNNDGDLSPAELKHAQQNPLLARYLQRLIARYESEWGGGMQKWDELDSMMMRAQGNEWAGEKVRIRKLQWWETVQGVKDFPSSLDVFHFHPLAMISNFMGLGTKIIDGDLVRRLGDLIAHGEGGYDSYNSGTKNVPEGKVGFSFRNPPAGTVTGKTIDEILATEPLDGTNRNRMFATGKYQTIFGTLKAAKAKLGLTGNEKYDAELQERVFREYLLYKAGDGALGRLVIEGKGTVDDAQMAAAQEWASIAAPKGRKIASGAISDGTMSYHQSLANKANVESTPAVRALLVEILESKK